MLLWFLGLGVVIVWQVFRDTAIDYRLVMAGVLLPDLAELVTGRTGAAHAVVASAGLLTVVMLATRGRRALRRQLLALPVGTFLHLVLDGAWTEPSVFWWPAFGPRESTVPLSFHRPLVVTILQEAAGLAALLWWWRRFRLHESRRRTTFLRTGRLGPDLVA